ncbi:hypothetical protein [Yersinia enterocolitica]|jgi:hypothetical protein|uniref:hypothetical protein n=1 Tax=Yersinia enterocolitica TaxID=630 RepID=UPI003D006B98|nr:hypothetical protein [Yersinia enterocolitica]EKN6090246.1 hypothetical protein [Yersinia enterocolitica]
MHLKVTSFRIYSATHDQGASVVVSVDVFHDNDSDSIMGRYINLPFNPKDTFESVGDKAIAIVKAELLALAKDITESE